MGRIELVGKQEPVTPYEYTRYVFEAPDATPPARAVIRTNGDKVVPRGPFTVEQCEEYLSDTPAEDRNVLQEAMDTFGYGFDQARYYVTVAEGREYPGGIDAIAAASAQLVLGALIQ